MHFTKTDTANTLPCVFLRPRHNMYVRMCQSMVNKRPLLCRDNQTNTRQSSHLYRASSVAEHGKSFDFAVCLRSYPRQKMFLCRAPRIKTHGKEAVSIMPASGLCRAPHIKTHGIMTIWSSATCQEHRWAPRVLFAVCTLTAQAFAVCLDTAK